MGDLVMQRGSAGNDAFILYRASGTQIADRKEQEDDYAQSRLCLVPRELHAFLSPDEAPTLFCSGTSALPSLRKVNAHPLLR